VNPASKPLRLWPGVVLVALQWLVRFGLPIVMPDALELSVFGGLVGGVLVVVWWFFFSRAPWVERWGAVLLMVVALGVTSRILDRSIATGMMGLMLPIYAVPVLSLAFVLWAVATQKLSDGLRRGTMLAAILLACGVWTLLRTNGISGDAASDFAWRWAKTPEDKLLAHPIVEKPPEAVPPPIEPTAPRPIAIKTPTADWPGFRGPHRDGIVPGVRIKTDWTKSPPAQMWRRPIGPGWSSFAVHGNFLYTQEQRGSDELVSCYNLTTGEPVWIHRDAARFWESNAGPGPRATPTVSNGRLYTFGATGIVNALDARTGAVVWSRTTDVKVPEWGFASSPLVVGDSVIVAASGKLVDYDLATGEPRWVGPDGGTSYSSPQLLTVDRVEQLLLLSETGATSVALADGAVLWKYPWPGYPIVQPELIPERDVLISVSEGSGTRRLAIVHGPTGWSVEERWTSAGLKPYFNDFVVHNGHAFGFDGGILACIDLQDGKRVWKGGRYGHGQLILLPDQDLLVILSEEGELALVAAASDQFKELARFPAIEGKTWNHPVLAGDILLVRNGQEMAAFRLSLMNSGVSSR
jgi:outer membrane protein assembly factor BamB